LSQLELFKDEWVIRDEAAEDLIEQVTGSSPGAGHFLHSRTTGGGSRNSSADSRWSMVAASTESGAAQGAAVEVEFGRPPGAIGSAGTVSCTAQIARRRASRASPSLSRDSHTKGCANCNDPREIEFLTVTAAERAEIVGCHVAS
jgi:hypothetical protein